MNIKRRNFIKKSSLIVSGVGLSGIAGYQAIGNFLHRPESDRINIGVIGVGMGCRDLEGALDKNPWVNCVAMCDVNRKRMEKQASKFKKKYPKQTSNLKLYEDFREVIKNSDIHGLIIATPDHWHAYIYAEALKAGKAVYIEKPVANSIEECNVMADFQKKHHGLITTGLWQTSQKYFKRANEILSTGTLGDIFKIQIWISQSTDPVPETEDSNPPADLNYDMWLGPAPERPFNQLRVSGWRGFWDYGGGQQTDWGVHWIDAAFDGIEALGLSGRVYPKAVFSTAHKHPETFNETPGCQTTIFQYENFHIEWTQQVANLYGRNQGVAWIGSKGTLVCNREGYELIPNINRNGKMMIDPVRFDGAYAEGGIDAHVTNWCRSIRNNSVHTNSPFEKGAFATILAHMGNISYRTGTKVIYDPVKRKFIDNDSANLLLRKKYRYPWKLFLP